MEKKPGPWFFENPGDGKRMVIIFAIVGLVIVFYLVFGNAKSKQPDQPMPEAVLEKK